MEKHCQFVLVEGNMSNILMTQSEPMYTSPIFMLCSYLLQTYLGDNNV